MLSELVLTSGEVQPAENIAAVKARPIRLAVLNSHPIQYFAPLYAYLNEGPSIRVTAIYLSDISIRGGRDSGFGQDVRWDIDLLEGYESVFVDDAVGRRVPNGFFSLVAPALWRVLRSGGYDALWINGHNFAANHIAIAAAKSVGMPVLMRCETHLGLKTDLLRRTIRRPVMSAFYKKCDGFLAIGSANRSFYLAMGVPERKIFSVPYSVDNKRFMKRPAMTVKQRMAERRKIGIENDAPAILYASKFQSRKHPDDLIRAASALSSEDIEFHLVMAGSGELLDECKRLANDLGVRNALFPGFVNQSALPALYAACDVFVLPSETEPWGLVVNEAMCAGLPVIVADGVGCVADLVKDGVTGYSFSAGDVGELTDALRTLIRDNDLRAEMSRAAVTKISSWGYEQCRQGLYTALDSLGLTVS